MMTLDQFLAMCEEERQRRRVAFVISQATFAIGTAEPSFRSPLEFLADCCHEAADGKSLDLAALAHHFGMALSLIEQIVVASDGGCSGYLRDRLEDACGLGEPTRSCGTSGWGQDTTPKNIPTAVIKINMVRL